MSCFSRAIDKGTCFSSFCSQDYIIFFSINISTVAYDPGVAESADVEVQIQKEG